MPTIQTVFRNRWTRYALTLLLLALVLYKVQPGHLLHAADAANPGYLLLALLLTAPFLLLKIARWYLMLEAGGIDASMGEAATSLLGGMGLALLTPARLGELIRVAYLRDPQKLRIGGLVLIDKGFDVLGLTLLSIAGAWALLGPAAGIAMAAVTLVGLLVVLWPHTLLRLVRVVGGRMPFGSKLILAGESLESLSPASSTLFLALTLASFAVVLVQFGIILASWRSPSVVIVFFTFPLVILTNVLPLTIGGLGLREGAAAALLGHYGVPGAQAALAAFLMFAINTALPGLVGALLTPGTRPRSGTEPATPPG